MSFYDHHADIETRRQVQQADHEGRASDAAYEAAKLQTHIDGCMNNIMEPTSCGCGCHRGIVNARHEVHLKKHKRIPLDPHFQPICQSCGALADPMDREDARTLGRRHAASMAADVAAGVSGDE